MVDRPTHRTKLLSCALLASIAIGAACTAAPSAPNAPGKPGGGGAGVAPISVGTAPLVKDILAPTLSYSGNVQARSSVSLVPKISARLEKLNADIGDEVKSGQVIAELDRAQLDAQVQQSDAALTAAQARLEQTQATAKQEDVDAAQAVVDQAKARLDQARSGGRVEEIASARATADQAAARADQIAGGARDLDRVSLQAAIDQAEAQQDQLRAQLASAQQVLSEAKYRLDQAKAGQGGPNVRPEDIAQAQATLETNKVKLAQIKNPRIEDIRIAQADVEKAKSDLEAADNDRDNCGKTSTKTSSSSTQTTATGQTKSSTESRSKQSCTGPQKDSLDAKIDSARAALSGKLAALEKIKNPSQYDVQSAEQAVALAEANLQKVKFGGSSDVAALQLKIAQSQAEVDRLQAALDQASASIASAQSKLDAAVNPDPRDIAQAQAAAAKARADMLKVVNPDPFGVQVAQATYDQAQAQLAGRIKPFTEQEIKVAASGVNQAAAALEVSRVQAAEAIIKAPFDATVSQKLLNPGAMASPNTPILGLVSKDVEIVVQVEEARIGQLQRGQPASLGVSAYPGQQFPGIVQAVAPSADTKSRTFAVRVVPQQQDGRLRDGMFAQVNIVGAGLSALLVPNDAIVTRAGRNQVFVVQSDKAQARELRLGETDGKRTAILDGKLQVGDEVVMTDPDALSDGAAVVVEQRNMQPGSRPRSSQPTGNGGAPSGGAPSSPREGLPAGQTGGQGGQGGGATTGQGGQGGQSGGQGR